MMDANVFITAHRQLYPFDVAPSFWEQLVDKAADKNSKFIGVYDKFNLT